MVYGRVMIDLTRVISRIRYVIADDVKLMLEASTMSIPVWFNGVVPGVVWCEGEGKVNIAIDEPVLRNRNYYDRMDIDQSDVQEVTYRGDE